MNRDDIFKAIETKQILKTSIEKDGKTIVCNIIPLKLTGDNTIVGELEGTSKKIVVDALDILTEGSITMSSKTLNNVDTKKLADISDKTNIEITESADGEFDVSKTQISEESFEKDDSTFNLTTWAAQLDVELSNFSNLSEGLVTCKIIIKNLEKLIIIYPSGDIKIGGHLIKTFNEFKNIIKFFSNI